MHRFFTILEIVAVLGLLTAATATADSDPGLMVVTSEKLMRNKEKTKMEAEDEAEDRADLFEGEFIPQSSEFSQRTGKQFQHHIQPKVQDTRGAAGAAAAAAAGGRQQQQQSPSNLVSGRRAKSKLRKKKVIQIAAIKFKLG